MSKTLSTWARRVVGFGCLGLLLVLPSPILGQSPKPVLKIVLITHKPEGFHNGFWDAIQAGARLAARELNVELEYRGIDPSFASKRVEGQTALFAEYVSRGFNGIAFTPSDRIRMAVPVKAAVAAGLKVVALDSEVDSPLLSGIFATNNYEGGRLAARTLAEAIGGQGPVLLLAHPTRDNKATRDRELAFAAELRNHYPRISLVSADRFGGATVETDVPVVRQLLDAYPGVKGVYAISGSGLEAFMVVLEERRLAGRIKLVGWDAGPATIEGLRRGLVSAIMQQHPQQMAYKGVKALVAALRGNDSRQVVDTGVEVVRPDNLDSAEIKALLFPDFRDLVR